VLLLEKALVSFFVDSASAQTAHGLGAVMYVVQHWGFRFLVSLAIAAAVFGYLRGGQGLQDVDIAARGAPAVRPRWLLAHVALLVPLVPLSALLYGPAVPLPFGVVVVLWLLLATVAAVALFAGLGTWALWQQAVRALSNVWWYAAFAAAAAAWAIGWSQSLWAGMARVTLGCLSGARLAPADLTN
jgi:hypothetical protein